MSEFYVYDSDNSDCGLIESSKSKESDSTIENSSPESVHDDILELPVSHNSSVSGLVNTISSKS